MTLALACLEVLECDKKIYLACPRDGVTITIWDIQNESKITTLNTESEIRAMRVFIHGDKNRY